MSALFKFFRLQAPDRRMITEAAAAVITIRVALWLVEFGRLRAALDRLAALLEVAASTASAPVERVTWAVSAVSARVPRATCLTQALAARLMLERRRVPATLRIGVARTAEYSVEAHAWLECDGHIVIGEAEPGRYTALGSQSR
jgi:hypothetical protein